MVNIIAVIHSDIIATLQVIRVTKNMSSLEYFTKYNSASSKETPIACNNTTKKVVDKKSR